MGSEVCGKHRCKTGDALTSSTSWPLPPLTRCSAIFLRKAFSPLYRATARVIR